MQNSRLPSFFLTNATTLHQALWLGLIAPDSNIFCRWFQTSSINGGGICLNHSLKEVSSVTFIVCSVEWVQSNSAGSNENMSWYLARSQWAASANSGAQESRPLKSNSSQFMMSLPNSQSGGMGILGLISPLQQLDFFRGLGTGNAATALATGVFL